MGEKSNGNDDRVAISKVTFITAGLAGIIVPPSTSKPSLTELEQGLCDSIVWLLFLAFVGAGCGQLLAKSGRLRTECILAVLSVICINVAGCFSDAYGIEGGNLLMTILMTSPAIGLIVQSVIKSRRTSLVT